MGIGRRHEFLGISGLEALDDFALGHVSGRKHSGVERILAIIEPKVSLRFPGPVALKTGVRENGADISIEIDLPGGERTYEKCEGNESFHEHENLVE
ncbi:MAG: hypothetical protein ACJAQT_003258 [Akkermansiaceae bacterium]|jgi:hypothetical protein